jgi:hypothetical protein
MPNLKRIAVGFASLAVLVLAGCSGAGTSPATSVNPTQTAAGAASQAVATHAAATPVATLDTTSWVPYTSPLYGFTVAHPGQWSEQPATERWAYATQSDAGIETIWSPSGWPEFTGFETRVPGGMTTASFLQAFTADAVKTACYPTNNQLVPTTIDGHAAGIAYAGCNEHFYFAQAVVVIGSRVWFFDLIGPDRTLILPFLSTIKLDLTKLTD